MNALALRIALGIGMALVIGLLAIEISGWKTGARLVNRRQKAFRAVSGGLIFVILAMVMIGDGPARARGPLMVIGYWALCFALACAVVVLALADMKQVALRFREERKHNFDDLAGRKQNRRSG